MTKRKIYFRADASATIGYGHFVRTLALADMLKDDFECTFFTTSPSAYQIGEMEKGCAFVSLKEDSKFEDFLNLLTGDEIVVLDNYFFTTEYMNQIKACGCRLVHIDDVHDRHFNADLIINHGNAKAAMYDANPDTRFCIGPSYALLRKPFLERNITNAPRKGKWVICFGGSDQYNLTEKVARALANIADEVVAIVGSAYNNRASLSSITYVNTLSSLSAEQMAYEFSTAENVVCSASSVSYEALACGSNVYAGYYVDNQQDFYEGLIKNNLITPLGNLFEADFNKLLVQKKIAVNKIEIDNVRHNLVCAFKALDLRIVNYTEMTLDESRKVWEVRNLPEIRKCMTQPEAFPFESHQRFVESLKDNHSKLYYAIFLGDDLVGSYDFNGIKDGDSAEHGLYINPAYNGRGYGTIIESVMDSYIRERDVHRILAEVLKNNQQSYHYHLKVGYKVYQEDAKYYYLDRFIQ